MAKPVACLFCGEPWETVKEGKKGFALVCYTRKKPRPHRVTVFWLEERTEPPKAEPPKPAPTQAERQYLAEVTELLERVNRLGERGNDE